MNDMTKPALPPDIFPEMQALCSTDELRPVLCHPWIDGDAGRCYAVDGHALIPTPANSWAHKGNTVVPSRALKIEEMLKEADRGGGHTIALDAEILLRLAKALNAGCPGFTSGHVRLWIGKPTEAILVKSGIVGPGNNRVGLLMPVRGFDDGDDE